MKTGGVLFTVYNRRHVPHWPPTPVVVVVERDLVEADGISRDGDKLPGAAPRRYTEPILSF